MYSVGIGFSMESSRAVRLEQLVFNNTMYTVLERVVILGCTLYVFSMQRSVLESKKGII